MLLPVDEEDLLLKADVGLEPHRGGAVVVQLVQHAAAVLAHGGVVSEEWGLLVKGFAVVANKDDGDMDATIEGEGGERGVWGEVPTSRFVGRCCQSQT